MEGGYPYPSPPNGSHPRSPEPVSWAVEGEIDDVEELPLLSKDDLIELYKARAEVLLQQKILPPDATIFGEEPMADQTGAWCVSPEDENVRHWFPRMKYEKKPVLTMTALCGRRFRERSRDCGIEHDDCEKCRRAISSETE